jgi:uncharacterized 2Fe-2S/4Fe-4S cluster protein (DUF4445 family)
MEARAIGADRAPAGTQGRPPGLVRGLAPPRGREAHVAQDTCTVEFLPAGVTVRTPAGISLLDAARKAGVYLSSICGGDGICGKCKLVLDAGEVSSKPTSLLSRDEIRQNVVLACETTVQGDVTVTVPDEHTLDKASILIEDDAHRFSRLPGTPSGKGVYAQDPLVKKVRVHIPPATAQGGMGQHDRVYAAIRRQLLKRLVLFLPKSAVAAHRGDPDALYAAARRRIDGALMQTGYKVLQGLPALVGTGACALTATVGFRGGALEVMDLERGNTSRRIFGVAVDLGTTTVVAHLVDLHRARTVDTEATYNRQMKYGDDYIRRIMYAETHGALAELHRCLVADVNGLVAELVRRNDVELHDVAAVLCAGNTAMIHFLLQLDPSGIRKEPYAPVANVIPPFRAAEVGIKTSRRGLLYCLPAVSAYVGSDITAGVIATGLDRGREVCLFVDIGTNGEVVLGNRDWLACASSSAGPAFEGGGIRDGMRAAPGAIERLSIGPGRRVTIRTVSNRPARGVCGSGLLDAMCALFENGAIGRNGVFAASGSDWSARLRSGEHGPEFLLADRPEAERPLVLTQPDIHNLIRSKAGIYAAISLLMKETGVRREDIAAVYLAGGFGNYLDVSKAVAIGMLPKVPPERVHFVGNAAIAGAKMALLSSEACDRIHAVADSMTCFDLMSDPAYMEQFVKATFIPHTDVEDW